MKKGAMRFLAQPPFHLSLKSNACLILLVICSRNFLLVNSVSFPSCIKTAM